METTAAPSSAATLDLALPELFRGEALRSGDAGYDEARRVFNAMIDRRPALIARCRGTADVIDAVGLARDRGLPLSVHGGGHSVGGHAVCEAGVMIDLRPMSTVHVDPAARVARVGGGANWGDVDRATQLFGLAVPGGRVPATGVGGLALGSGSGWLERKLGFTCDSLLSAEVVTADGRVLTASAEVNTDLFWGLRGGGGNFGVVTSFEFRLHPVGPLLWGGMLMFPGPRAAEVARAYRDFMSAAPDDVGGGMAFISAPDAPFVPEEARGRPTVAAVCVYTGDPGDGEAAFAPLLGLDPAMAMVQPMPYTAIQKLLEEPSPPGLRNYWNADFLDDLPDAAIDVVADFHARVPSPFTQIPLLPGGGAIARVDEDADALGYRQAPWNLHLLSLWTDPADDERNIAWTREFSAAMRPWTAGRAYLNFLGPAGPDRIRAAYGEEKFPRMQALKDKYDPGNLFRLNQNITPTASA
jgi:FAD/FMN-containing dehydrogenase